MPTTAKLEDIKWSLRVKEEDVRRMYQTIASFVQSDPLVKIEFDNSTTIDKRDIDEALSDTNNLGNDIKRIAIICNNSSYGEDARSANIFLTRTNITTVVSGEGTGPTSEALSFRHDMMNIIKSCKTRHSFLYFSDNVAFGIITLIAISLTVGLAYVVSTDTYQKLVFPISAVTMLLLFSIYYVLRTKLYPRMIFDIGIGRDREAFRQSLNKYIVFGVISSIVISVIATFVSDGLKAVVSR